MGKQYRHLSSEERAVIQIEHGNGSSLRAIAQRLSRSVATVSRELARNRLAAGTNYEATAAASAYRSRRLRCVRRRKLVEGQWLHQHVHDRLVYRCWSPQQIAAKLRDMYPDDPACHVSHETTWPDSRRRRARSWIGVSASRVCGQASTAPMSAAPHQTTKDAFDGEVLRAVHPDRRIARMTRQQPHPVAFQ